MLSLSRTLEHCPFWSHLWQPGGHGVLLLGCHVRGFDHRSLSVQSHNLTTFQTPLGLLWLTSLPMGVTNSVQILQAMSSSFKFWEKMPEHEQLPFMDDVNIKGPAYPLQEHRRWDGIHQLLHGTPPPLHPVPMCSHDRVLSPCGLTLRLTLIDPSHSKLEELCLQLEWTPINVTSASCESSGDRDPSGMHMELDCSGGGGSMKAVDVYHPSSVFCNG